jgi:hypothetical protein
MMTDANEDEMQEETIFEMAKLAHTMFPDISKVIFKEIFRCGIFKTLKKFNYATWAEITKQESSKKTQFFKTILVDSILRLNNIGITDDQIVNLFVALDREKNNYLT